METDCHWHTLHVQRPQGIDDCLELSQAMSQPQANIFEWI